MNSTLNRRDFLGDSSRTAIAGWLALQLPLLGGLVACARDDQRAGKGFATLTPAEARAMRAFAAQIVPSGDGTPGAEEAGAVYFVDRALGRSYYAELVPVIRAGLADLDVRARSLEARDFAALSPERQAAVMRQVEREPFFAAARVLVVSGTLADPSHGGNRGMAGWTMLGIDHQPSYAAPYGWYDADAASNPVRRAS